MRYQTLASPGCDMEGEDTVPRSCSPPAPSWVTQSPMMAASLCSRAVSLGSSLVQGIPHQLGPFRPWPLSWDPQGKGGRPSVNLMLPISKELIPGEVQFRSGVMSLRRAGCSYQLPVPCVPRAEIRYVPCTDRARTGQRAWDRSSPAARTAGLFQATSISHCDF